MQNHHPTEIRRLSQSLSIEWKNGLRSEIPYRTLREKCPCARCSAMKQEKYPFRLLPSEDYWKNLHLVGIQPVGRYAVQLQWNDGHKTGIYTFSFLYELSTDTHQDVSSNNATTK